MCNIYTNFVDIIFLKLVIELFEYISINNYAIKLSNDKQLLCNFIYILGLMELKTLKTYIKNNLVNDFI